MKRCSVRPYEGKEPYIFISYCHKDRAFVFPIIENLARDGYRVWYDEGIDPGSEWPEIIASHLNNCTVCVAFISENSLNSHNCRREINFALLKNKKFISVILEHVKMSPGMEMQISAYQSIFKYKLSSESEFYAKLYAAETLKDCKGIPDYSITVSRPEDYVVTDDNDMFAETLQSRKTFSDKWFISTEKQISHSETMASSEESVELDCESESVPAEQPENNEIVELHARRSNSNDSTSTSSQSTPLDNASSEDDIVSAPSQDLIETQKIESSQIPLIIQTSKETPLRKTNSFFIIRVKTNEKIRILPGKIIIGRSETRADYQIIGNSTIGRVHASIELRDETCYITDLNSKNKTKINKVFLEPEKEYPLRNGDKIQLSNEVFIFKIVQE